MNRVAIFSDIHANLPALEAVLADMDARGLSDRYCLGDLVGYATFPNEVTQAIRASSIPCIMGNYDLGVGNNSDDCGCAYKDPVSEALGQTLNRVEQRAYDGREQGLPARAPRATFVRTGQPQGSSRAWQPPQDQ